jgi:hypothetical protein
MLKRCINFHRKCLGRYMLGGCVCGKRVDGSNKDECDARAECEMKPKVSPRQVISPQAECFSLGYVI